MFNYSFYGLTTGVNVGLKKFDNGDLVVTVPVGVVRVTDGLVLYADQVPAVLETDLQFAGKQLDIS